MEVNRAFNHYQDAQKKLALFNALNLILNKNGQCTSSERSFHSVVSSLSDDNVLIRDGVSVKLGPYFESFILKMCDTDTSFTPLLLKYRKLIIDNSGDNCKTSKYTEILNNITLYDHKLEFLASTIGELDAEISKLSEKVEEIQILLQEFDFTLSMIESVVFDESTDS